MRQLISIILGAIIVPAICASDGDAWSYLMAAGGFRSLGGAESARAFTDSIVTYVGADGAAAAQEAGPRSVITVDLPLPPGSGITPHLPVELISPAFPSDSQWPDAKGRIAVGSPTRPKASGNAGIRNPWEVRSATRAAAREIPFECGGIVTGGDRGPVAIVNGRIARRGDSFGEFSVAGILPIGVMLERNGSYLVIPRGRPTTVAVSGD